MSSIERSRILAQMQGQKIRIPDLHAIFLGWPQNSSKHEASIVPVINKILDSNAYDKSIAAKLKQEKLAMLISRWWPYADLDTLLELAQFVGCIFTVDGLIDHISGQGIEKDELFDALYRSTDIFAAHGHDSSHHANMPVSSNPALSSFRVLVELLGKRYTSEQRKIFLHEVKFTLEALSIQRRLRVSGKIPSLEEYSAYRVGSCCINAMVALIDHLCIPKEVMKDAEMTVLRKEAVSVNWIMNDILSVKKELAGEFVENLVVLCAKDGNAQTGVDTALSFLRSSKDRFEIAAATLASRYAGNETLARDIHKFVEGCRCLCMGSYIWRSVSYHLQTSERRVSQHIIALLRRDMDSKNAREIHLVPSLLCFDPQRVIVTEGAVLLTISAR